MDSYAFALFAIKSLQHGGACRHPTKDDSQFSKGILNIRLDSYLLKFLDSTLVNATALVDQVALGIVSM